QIVDQPCIAHVTIDDGRAVLCDRFDDVGAIFKAALERDLTRAIEHLTDRGIVIFAPGRPVIGVEASLSQVAWATVALNQFWPLAEVGHILREVAAALGHKRAKVKHYFKAYRVALIDLGIFDALAQTWIHILALVAQLGKPGIVV